MTAGSIPEALVSLEAEAIKHVHVSSVLLASAARTLDAASVDQTNEVHRGVQVTIDVTIDPASASVTPHIQGKDAAGVYFDLLVGAAIADVGTTVLTVYPGIAEAANVKASNVLPADWRVSMDHADTDSITYSVSAVKLL